jgi:phosphoenolpyruvate carboxykinase (ATP)
MLIRPTADQLASFGDPDYVVFNAGVHPADDSIDGVTSKTCVALDFSSGHFVIQGTEYAGEMKKGVFTVMNYLMPKQGGLSMHCSANEGAKGDVTLFFGLSGTGKTTLSADPHRALIGDDEHCWTDTGLSAEKEPEIFDAVRFGTLLENTVQHPATRETQYNDNSLTENTRASYPIDFMPRAKIPCIGGHPKNVIFLTCDAFGVLPPVSRLSPEQAMYHYISGYTAKVAGTEVGVTGPQATFSACFGAPFLVWHPAKYAQLLADKMRAHDAHCWLINTGWTGGPYGTGARIKLKYTRAIIDAIHDGSLAEAPMTDDPIFGFSVPTECASVPDEILLPRNTWSDPDAYDAAADRLATLFVEHFTPYDDSDAPQIKLAGPHHASSTR